MSADKPIPLRDGGVLDLRKPWRLPQHGPEWQEQMDFDADVRAKLESAAEKANPRRFTGEPPTVFADLPEEDDHAQAP